MTIVIKFLTVVTRIETIKRKYPGGLDAYVKDNLVGDSFRDRHIAGVLFMSTGEAEEFIGTLVNLGFSHIKNNESDEIALIDMFVGPLLPCPWLETNLWMPFEKEAKQSTCWLKGTSRSDSKKRKTIKMKGANHGKSILS